VAIWAFRTLRRRGVTQSAATAAVCTPGYASARVDPALLQKVAQEWEDQLGLAERVHGDIGDFLRANPVNWQLSFKWLHTFIDRETDIINIQRQTWGTPWP